MTVSLVILWVVLGGLWRRIFGGWTGLPRSICYALMLPLTLPIWLAMPWGIWWPYCIVVGVCMTILCAVFFIVSLAPGPSFTNARCFLKYGPFGAGYWLARLYWPASWVWGGFIDGPFAVGELFLGASFWGCVALLWCL